MKLLAQNIKDIFGEVTPPDQVKAISPEGGAAGVNVFLERIITLFFLFGGIAFVVIFIWGAVDFIISRGEKEAVAKAREKIRWAVVGLFLLSFSFVLFRIIEDITGFKIIFF